MKRYSLCLCVALLGALLALCLGACSSAKKVSREHISADQLSQLPQSEKLRLQQESPFLKLHMRNGNLYVLERWNADSTRLITGEGQLLDAQRKTLQTGAFSVGVDSIALAETNQLQTSGSAIALAVFTGITAAITIVCVTTPKACFGSCPTFYVSDGDSLRLQAEGFSSSIAPSLEAADIDAIPSVAPESDDVTVIMKNEALETHVVRYADILAVPRAEGERVFADKNGGFWKTNALFAPVAARAPEGDCAELLRAADGRERFSKSDSAYLGAKEEIEMEFPNPPFGVNACGLALACRQTLLSTYLVYQAFAYMGTQAAWWLAEIERKNIRYSSNALETTLGGIEVWEQDSSGAWTQTSVLDEYGPLAPDTHIVPLKFLQKRSKSATGTIKIRLRAAKGNYRIDYAALATNLQAAKAERVRPRSAEKDGKADAKALAALLDSAQTLVTLPGDAYALHYRLPQKARHYEIFLESRGYYLEWMRKEWIAEENPALLAQMFLDPQTALRRLAPEFKRAEADMERYFWGSRYAKP